MVVDRIGMSEQQGEVMVTMWKREEAEVLTITWSGTSPLQIRLKKEDSDPFVILYSPAKLGILAGQGKEFHLRDDDQNFWHIKYRGGPPVARGPLKLEMADFVG